MRTHIFLILCLFLTGKFGKTDAREVSHEEIRDAIISLVHSYNLLDNKLERHEHRERALGELLKRGLATLQKGQKAYEPMIATFTRLDERISQIETMLIAQEEKTNLQNFKLNEVLDVILQNMRSNSGGCNSVTSSVVPNAAGDTANNKVEEKLDILTRNVKNLTATILSQTEAFIGSRSSSADEVISKLEDKLSPLFYITTPVTPAPSGDIPVMDLEEDKISNYLEKIWNNLETIKRAAPQAIANTGGDRLSPDDRVFLSALTNEALAAVADVRSEILKAANESLSQTSANAAVLRNMNEVGENVNTKLDNVLTELADSAEKSENFYGEVNKTSEMLHNGFEIFQRFDKVLLSTSEHILDTQRKVEFAVHQIQLKVGDVIRNTAADLNKRFDAIDGAIALTHFETLRNVTGTMESEISAVWRMLEVMNSEIFSSKDTLNKLQGQTEGYVNGTMTTIDGMKGKVSQITDHIDEMDSNLNFLLGRLSMVTKEFNNVRDGLGEALEELQKMFGNIRSKTNKTKDDGSLGPHPIESDELVASATTGAEN